mgnify:CR=1 FL=1
MMLQICQIVLTIQALKMIDIILMANKSINERLTFD